MYNYQKNYKKKIICLAYSIDYVMEIKKWLFNRWCTTTTFKIWKFRRKLYYFFFINEMKNIFKFIPFASC